MLVIRHLRRSRVIVIVVVTLGLVGACLAVVPFLGDHQQSSRTAAVELRGADGLGLRVAKVNGMSRPAGPVRPDSAVYHITPDGPLPRPVTILIPLSHRASPSQQKLVFVFAKETATGKWRPLKTTVVRDGTYASVTVRRLSWFGDFTVDPGQILAELKNFFRELTNGAFNNASLPSCDRSSAAQSDGYRYATDGTAMLACFGVDSNGGRVIKLVDNRRYPELITTSMPVAVGSSDIFQKIAQMLTPDGYVVYPQSEADLSATIPSRTKTVTLFARTDLAPEGQLLSSLSTGIDALTTILGAVGDTVKVSERVKILQSMLEVQACRDSTDAEEMIANCLTVRELTGSFGDVLGLILAPVVTVTGLYTYFRGALNGIFDQFDGRSKFVAAVQRGPSPAAILEQVNWGNYTYPASWFLAKVPTVRLTNGRATSVPTAITGAAPSEPQDIYLTNKVAYGQVSGLGEVAAVNLCLIAAGGGTADAQRGCAWLIYKAGSKGGATYVGPAIPQSGWPGAWTSNPSQAEHVDLTPQAYFENNELVMPEMFYGPNDFTACPTGRATSVWVYQNGDLKPTLSISQEPSNQPNPAC
jgi:hypothetical protein